MCDAAIAAAQKSEANTLYEQTSATTLRRPTEPLMEPYRRQNHRPMKSGAPKGWTKEEPRKEEASGEGQGLRLAPAAPPRSEGQGGRR